MRSKVFFEQRVAGVDEFEGTVGRYFGDNGFEFSGEFDFCFDEIELGDGVDGRLDCGKLFAELLRQFEENAGDLAFFFTLDVLEFVIGLDGVEWFDEDGGSAG